jgi:hypothetical protein
MRYIFVVYLFSILAFGNSFEKFYNVVIDHTTHKTWQDNDEVVDFFQTYDTAQVYCKMLTLNTHTNWRIPTIKELQTILDIKQKHFTNKVFKNSSDNIYYTSTPFAKDSNYHLGIDFSNGKIIKIDNKNSKYIIRCIRENNSSKL